MARVEDAILKNLEMFVAFARKRLGDHHLAEDVVQDSLIKAFAADRHPETDEETTTWFYRILRRSIIDVYRKQGAQRRALERFKKELFLRLENVVNVNVIGENRSCFGIGLLLGSTSR